MDIRPLGMTRPQLWPWLLDQSFSIFLISMTPLLHIPFIIYYSSPSFFAVKTENQDQTTADLRVSVWLRHPCPINLRPKSNTKRCPHLEVTLLLHWKVILILFRTCFHFSYLQNINCLFLPSFYVLWYFIFIYVSTSLRDAAQIGDAVIYLQLHIRDAALIWVL